MVSGMSIYYDFILVSAIPLWDCILLAHFLVVRYIHALSFYTRWVSILTTSQIGFLSPGSSRWFMDAWRDAGCQSWVPRHIRKLIFGSVSLYLHFVFVGFGVVRTMFWYLLCGLGICDVLITLQIVGFLFVFFPLCLFYFFCLAEYAEYIKLRGCVVSIFYGIYIPAECGWCIFCM